MFVSVQLRSTRGKSKWCFHWGDNKGAEPLHMAAGCDRELDAFHLSFPPRSPDWSKPTVWPMIPMMSAGDKPQGNLSGAHLKSGSDHAENLSKHIRFSGYILHGWFLLVLFLAMRLVWLHNTLHTHIFIFTYIYILYRFVRKNHMMLHQPRMMPHDWGEGTISIRLVNYQPIVTNLLRRQPW